MSLKIFLAATSHVHTAIDKTKAPYYLLESFMDLKSGTPKKEEYIKWCLSAKEFLLDSGAYAFMNKTNFKENFDYSKLDEYVNNYINFINKWNIKLFFEMDLDNIVGYSKVLDYRKLIEDKTGNHFGSAYFCNKFLPENLILEELKKYQKPLKQE